MAELWINYTDENGDSGRVRVEGDRFTIGRQSSCDLPIANNRLSREHLVIERSGEGFIVSDNGSSNGTELNGQPLFEPTEIMSGDRADLGGGLDIEFEIVWDGQATSPATEAGQPSVANVSPGALNATPQAAAPSQSSGGFPIAWLIIGPLAAIVVLAVGILLVLLIGGGGSTPDPGDRNIRTRSTPDEEPSNNRSTPDKTPVTTASASPGGTNSNIPVPSPTNLGENAKVEQDAASFLRRIAKNEPKAFLTSEQSQKLSSRVKQFANSSTLAANIESARSKSAALKDLATKRNLKPQLLVTAALAKLGSSRGDVLQTAESMAPILEKLQGPVGSELADDCLMMIAAYDQGEHGDFLKLRNMLQDLANKFPDSSRAIRSIWFLQKQGKITDGEFDFALRFLAIGTITQNPKDFGVSAEPLVL